MLLVIPTFYAGFLFDGNSGNIRQNRYIAYKYQYFKIHWLDGHFLYTLEYCLF